MNRTFFSALVALIGVSFLLGCHEEDPPPPPHPIVGKWTLDAVIMTNLPTNFKGWEGQTFSATQWFEIIYGVNINSFTTEFNNDSSYLSVIDLLGPNEEETGKWSESDNILVMSPDGQTFDYEYEIVGSIEETEMTLSERLPGITLLPDEVADTLTDVHWSNAGLMDTLWMDYGTAVDLDLWWIYNR